MLGPAGDRLFRRVRPCVPLVLLFVLCLSAAAVVHFDRLISLDQLTARIGDTSATRICLAAVTALASYCALIGYDRAALRMLRKKVPAKTVALGAFSGHAFHNAIGWGPLSGGAVRYRLYAPHGVSLLDIAAISAMTAATSGMGLVLLCLLTLALSPDALAGYISASPATISECAAVGLLLTSSTVAALSAQARRLVDRFRLQVPRSAAIAGLALVVLAETGLEAVTLYLLIGGDAVPFTTFLPVFYAAISVGLLSHLPGGIGVFEAVILAGLAPSVGITRLASALVIYRVVYNLVPFFLATLLLAWREVLALTHAGASPEPDTD